MEKLQNKELIKALKKILVSVKTELLVAIEFHPEMSDDEEGKTLMHDIDLLKSLLPE